MWFEDECTLERVFHEIFFAGLTIQTYQSMHCCECTFIIAIIIRAEYRPPCSVGLLLETPPEAFGGTPRIYEARC